MKKRINNKKKPAAHVNHTRKDSIFSLLFGTPDNLRSLYENTSTSGYAAFIEKIRVNRETMGLKEAAQGLPGDLRKNPAVIKAYLGSDAVE